MIRIKSVIAFVSCIAIVVTICGCGGGSPTRPSTNTPAVPVIPAPVVQTYSVFGQVTVAATTAPLEGARIEVTEIMDDNTHVTSSDANGMFRVSGLRGGFSHLVAVSRDGFEPKENWVNVIGSDIDVRQDFQLLEQRVSPPLQISGEWRGTISNQKDPMDDPAPCPEAEEITGKMEQSGRAVTADLKGKCNRVQFEGLIEGGSLIGKIILIFPQETFTGSATGVASPVRIQLNATLRSPLGHTIPGFELVLTR